MTQHVYARVAGFQLAVIPLAPFRIRRATEPANAIDVEYHAPDEVRSARLIPEDAGYRSQLGEFTASLNDVLDVAPGPDLDEWRIETFIFTCCWPSDYTLCSNNFPAAPGPFDLVGPHHEMITIQHPKTIPDIEQMCAPGQTVLHVQRTPESDWIDLAYEYEGAAWWQRHEVVPFPDRPIAVTMQAPLEVASDAIAAAQLVAHSLAPFTGE